MKLAIYQTSDLHGFVYPTNYVTDQNLGILKIGSYILNDEKKYDASLKIDCGDLIQGSALTNYLSKKELENNPIIEGAEYIGYDAYVLGNHEFNYGLNYLECAYKNVGSKVINANIEGLAIATKPYKIFDFDGFKIGCIGLTTSFIPNWEQPCNIEGLKFNDPVAMYGFYEEELKNKCDYIIVCYHGGFEKSLDEDMTPTEMLNKENQASELLEKYDSIDVILSGHQHRSFITKIKNTICTQPKNNGQTFTKIVLDTDTKTASYELVETQNLNDEINEGLESIFAETSKELEVFLNKEIGTLSEDITIDNLFEARLNGHPFINMLNDIQLDISHADFSAVSIFDTAIGFKKHVTMKDVLINYPYANILKVIKLKGEKIKEAIEKSASYFTIKDGKVEISEDFLVPKIQNYNYDIYGGLYYEADLRRVPFDRVVSMKKDGQEIDLDKEYTVVLSSYRASNTSVYPCYEGAELIKEISLDMSEIIINYLQSKPVINVRDDINYKFIVANSQN